MKRTALTLTFILLLSSALTGARQFCLADVNAQETQPEIMSFEETTKFANINNYNGSVIYYELPEEPSATFTDELGFSGILIWLAPNGTIYQAEYPTGTVLAEVGYVIEASDLNPPNAITFGLSATARELGEKSMGFLPTTEL